MKQLHLVLDDTEYQAFQKLRAMMGCKYDIEAFRIILGSSIRQLQHLIDEHNKVQAAFEAGMNDVTPL